MFQIEFLASAKRTSLLTQCVATAVSSDPRRRGLPVSRRRRCPWPPRVPPPADARWRQAQLLLLSLHQIIATWSKTAQTTAGNHNILPLFDSVRIC